MTSIMCHCMSVLTIFREAPVLVYHLDFCRAVTPTKKPESRRVSTKQLQKIGDETSASSPNFNLALACASLLRELSTFFGHIELKVRKAPGSVKTIPSVPLTGKYANSARLLLRICRLVFSPVTEYGSTPGPSSPTARVACDRLSGT